MVARIRTVAFEGVDVRPVDAQVQVSGGMPAFTLVGLPDKAVGESRERVRAALTAIGLALPPKRITVNLAPADLLKEGSHFDLPIASIQWVIICYMLTHGSLMLACGRLGDLYGHTLVFRVGLTWNTVAFLLCAVAPSFEWLLAARVAQGVGAALIAACGPALITGLAPEAMYCETLCLPENPGKTVAVLESGQLAVQPPAGLPFALSVEPLTEAFALAGLEGEDRHVQLFVAQQDWDSQRNMIEALREVAGSLEVQLLPDGSLPLLAAGAVGRQPLSLMCGAFAPRTGLDIYQAPSGQRVRIGQRDARDSEMEDYLSAMVRANRAIGDAVRGKPDMDCQRALPKDLGDWQSTVEFTLGPHAFGKDLREISALDFSKSVERDIGAFCRQGYGALLAKLYRKANPERALVRTGWGGGKVITDGGTIVLPFLHQIGEVNLQTLRLEVQRKNQDALITKDRLRVDVRAEFYVRVAKNIEAIMMAAQTLGTRTFRCQLANRRHRRLFILEVEMCQTIHADEDDVLVLGGLGADL